MIEDFDAQHRWATLERARLLVELGRCGEAFEVLRPELLAQDGDGEMLALAALAQLGDGQLRDAEQLARAAVEASGDEEGWRVLSEVLEAAGRTTEAVQAASSATTSDPRSWLAQVRLSAALLAAGAEGAPARARVAAQAAVDLAPSEPHAHFTLAMAAVAQHDHAAAEASVRRCLDLDPEHVAARQLSERLREAALPGTADETPTGWLRAVLGRRRPNHER